jgi:hypothetical protein
MGSSGTPMTIYFSPHSLCGVLKRHNVTFRDKLPGI